MSLPYEMSSPFSGRNMGAPLGEEEFEKEYTSETTYDAREGYHPLSAPGMGRMMIRGRSSFKEENISRHVMRPNQDFDSYVDQRTPIIQPIIERKPMPAVVQEIVSTSAEFSKRLRGNLLSVENGSVLVYRKRIISMVSVSGVMLDNPLLQGGFFSYSGSYLSSVKDNRIVCFGQYSLQESEIEAFTKILKSHKGIKITSIQNHWMELNKNIWYVHWQGVMDPLQFADISSHAMQNC